MGRWVLRLRHLRAPGDADMDCRVPVLQEPEAKWKPHHEDIAGIIYVLRFGVQFKVDTFYLYSFTLQILLENTQEC